MKLQAVFLIALLSTTLFAQSSKGGSGLAFDEGSVHLGFGVNWFHGGAHSFDYHLNNNYTWDDRVYSETVYPNAIGFVLGLDVAAVGGMLSFGGDITLHYGEYDIDFYYNNGVWSQWERLKMWGIAPLFRANFHPFGIPSLKGKVKVANQLDPYVGFRTGADIAILDTEGRLNNINDPNYDASDVDVDFLLTPTIGVRWYPNGGHVGLWVETDMTNFFLAVTFNLKK